MCVYICIMETKKRTNAMLKPSTKSAYKKMGDGNLSAGLEAVVSQAAKRTKPVSIAFDSGTIEQVFDDVYTIRLFSNTGKQVYAGHLMESEVLGYLAKYPSIKKVL